MESDVPHSDDHSVNSDEESMAGEPLDRDPDEEDPIDVARSPRGSVIRATIRSVDEVNPRALFEKREAVMKAVNRFLRGPLRSALKLALEEATTSPDEVDQERGWKLFFMLPRRLLLKLAVKASSVIAQFEAFARGDWIHLVARAKRAMLRPHENRDSRVFANRASRAEMLVHLEELSSTAGPRRCST